MHPSLWQILAPNRRHRPNIPVQHAHQHLYPCRNESCLNAIVHNFDYSTTIRLTIYILIVTVVVLLTSCSSIRSSQHEQYHNIARQWMLTLRSHQMIPAYPMTSQLQPGDILIHNSFLGSQEFMFGASGFLPFEEKFASLTTELPQDSQSECAFPSFNFALNRDREFQTSFPFGIIDTGMALIDSDNVNVSVEIREADTIVSEYPKLMEQFNNWQDKDNVRWSLQNISKFIGPVDYLVLRVITRVYRAKTISVTLTARSNDSVTSNIQGNVKLPAMSSIDNILVFSNSITLEQSFDPPIVLGYRAIEYVINEHGEIDGPRIPQVDLSSFSSVDPDSVDRLIRLTRQFGKLVDYLNGKPSKEGVSPLQNAAKHISRRFELEFMVRKEKGDPRLKFLATFFYIASDMNILEFYFFIADVREALLDEIARIDSQTNLRRDSSTKDGAR